MGELLPCPICHEQPVRNGRGGKGGVLCNGEPAHRVQSYGADQAEADAAWNTRMTPPQDSVSDVERLRAIGDALLARPYLSDVDRERVRALLSAALAVPINKIGEDRK